MCYNNDRSVGISEREIHERGDEMNIKWDSNDYKQNFNFVTQYGEDVLGLLTVKPGAFVVDLGCGNGGLTQKLADEGYHVIGIDDSEDMIRLAASEYPHLEFRKENALNFRLEQPADAIFSNAVFHWIDGEKQDQLAQNIADNLKPGGELVCEFGGYHCAGTIHQVLEQCFTKRGLEYPMPFYFPTVGEHTPILERHGLLVEYAIWFERPTVKAGEDGAIDWINMFVKKAFEGMDPQLKKEIQDEAREMLREKIYSNGQWIIDYTRIRIRARKVTK